MEHETLQVSWSPAPDELRVVHDGLREFTDRVAGPVNARPLAIFIRDVDGRVVGGLDGELRWTWLYVAHLWLPEALRGRGIGSALLAQAERSARMNGATAAYLDTLEFQARAFYERRGYEVYGVLEGFPPASRRFYLQKRLVQAPMP